MHDVVHRDDIEDKDKGFPINEISASIVLVKMCNNEVSLTLSSIPR